jgi:hypothetical protein
MSRYMSRTSTKKIYNKDSFESNISVITNQLEKQHEIANNQILGGYKWKPEHDTLGDLIREHESLRKLP